MKLTEDHLSSCPLGRTEVVALTKVHGNCHQNSQFLLEEASKVMIQLEEITRQSQTQLAETEEYLHLLQSAYSKLNSLHGQLHHTLPDLVQSNLHKNPRTKNSANELAEPEQWSCDSSSASSCSSHSDSVSDPSLKNSGKNGFSLTIKGALNRQVAVQVDFIHLKAEWRELEIVFDQLMAMERFILMDQHLLEFHSKMRKVVGDLFQKEQNRKLSATTESPEEKDDHPSALDSMLIPQKLENRDR